MKNIYLLLVLLFLPGTKFNAQWVSRNSGTSEKDKNYSVGSGIYFYRVEAGRKIIIRKMILMR